jgi:hypothetical protein
MVLSRRERYIGIFTGAFLGALALYQFVVEPLNDTRANLDSQLAIQQRVLTRDLQRIRDSHQLGRKWMELAASGIKPNQSEAESQLVHSVTDWAQDAGVALPSQKPERPEREHDFYRLTLRATGTGTMAQISRFLWRIQTATIPARITDLQLSSRKEGTDDLQIVLGISTIYPAPVQNPDRGQQQ